MGYRIYSRCTRRIPPEHPLPATHSISKSLLGDRETIGIASYHAHNLVAVLAESLYCFERAAALAIFLGDGERPKIHRDVEKLLALSTGFRQNPAVKPLTPLGFSL